MTSNQKPDKYLTDMKELPPIANEAPKVEEIKKPAALPKASQFSSEVKKPIEKTEAKKETAKLEEKTETVITFKDVTLGIINLICIVFLIILLTKLPAKARELQKLRLEDLRNQENPVVGLGNIEAQKIKVQELENLFLDETGVVKFVGDVERLKSENPAIQKVTFANQKAVKDKVGLSGVPIIVELSGDWTSIGKAIGSIQALPYLFRPVNVSSKPSLEDPNVILFDYGGILYVNDGLGENR